MQDHSIRYKIAQQDSHLAEIEFLISIGIVGVPIEIADRTIAIKRGSHDKTRELYRERWDRAFQEFMRISEIDTPFARWWIQFVIQYTLYLWASREHYAYRSDIAMYSQGISEEGYYLSKLFHETILSLEEIGWNLAYHFSFVHFLYRGK